MIFGGELIGVAIVLLIGLALFVIYAVGLRYTYAGNRNTPGQNTQGGSGRGNVGRSASSDFYQR